MQNKLELIKKTHRAVPLCVFVEKRLIPPDDICNVLAGALVDLHFELYHYSIHSKDVDSFNAKIEQVMVLQPGESRPDTIYKRSTAEDGPICMNPALAAVLDDGPPLSASDASQIASSSSLSEDAVAEGVRGASPLCSNLLVVRADHLRLESAECPPLKKKKTGSDN